MKKLVAIGSVVLAAVALALLGLLLRPTVTSQTAQPNYPSATLSGSGATFPQAQINVWVSEFSKKYPTIKVEYAGGGSGKGQSDFIQGVVDFACSDVPLKTADWEKARSAYGAVYQIPWVAGGVAFVFNIPELGNATLRLSQSVLVNVLLGRVEYWDDPSIASLNPGLKLPHQKIIFVHRSDASGTTNVVTAFLSKVSQEWRERVGAGLTVQWPLDSVGRGVGAQGNQGVAQTVRNTPYSLGYVELAYTKNLGVVALENALSEYIIPTPESVAKALEGVSVKLDPASDVSKLNLLDQTLNVKASGAYPIVSVSYLIVKSPSAYPREKAKALSLFLEWVFTEGQRYIAEGYAPVAGTFLEAGRSVAKLLSGP
ncbi:phosphate ABC transporter substrate-binding protein PstS [Infirmifilum sp. NZ]|uniref:phosphate ABC transporter substrate-binding protein PstS n=1 Tax=Infirmifilum sp. NZ TaxID=2926850 RepID=UPI00279E7F53|nr:phosphate ABC transporter substrate-binding protein PstS [Infirmifilum sp. NZ]UNQ73079.1 phosphate ABC transporter substrate-binding protein PstS [Infirmifilum sp. NZ]